jgi:dTDP-4-amino-4,6-dideoxygalactose transaminase
MMKIPFVDLKAQYQSIKPEMDEMISNVINETAFIGGKYVKDFEAKFAALYGVKHVISCANGTDSLYIIMRSLGIGPGDEVITAANSWISSSETIGQTGATPVFVDCDEQYMSMDVAQLEAAITAKTKALIVVHLHGQISEMDIIEQLAKKHGLYVIEDCAQSHFSEYKGKRAGTMGIAGSLSFYPGKNLGAYGDAGCIITNDDDLANKCRMFANHGALIKHQHQIEGINSRMDGLQAGILAVKLDHILSWTEKRIERAAWYREALKDIPQISIPEVRPESQHSYHLFIIRTSQRNELMAFLKEKGIETAIHYPTPLPLLPAYLDRGFTATDYPVSSRMSATMLSLPIYPELSFEAINYVANTIQDFFAKQ